MWWLSPTDTGHLQEEANKALGELLAMKSSIDAHWQKLVWELSIAPHQNDSKTTESIKEAKAICTLSTQGAVTLCSTTVKAAKAICTHSTQEAKALYSTTVKEAETICAHSTQEAETLCSMTIREAGAQGASQTDSLQCSHSKSIPHLEEQAIEEGVRVSLTSSLPVKLPYEPALQNSTVCW